VSRSAAAPAALCLVLLLTGVVLLWRPAPDDSPTPDTTSTSPPAAHGTLSPPVAEPQPVTTRRPQPAPAVTSDPPTDQGEHLHRDVPEEQASWLPAEWDTTAREQAARSASDLISVWLAVDELTEPTWRRQSSTLVTADAAELITTVDPAELAPGDVTGPAQILQSPSPYLVTVSVPTTQGQWQVTLVRESGSDPWLAQRWEPLPEGRP